MSWNWNTIGHNNLLFMARGIYLSLLNVCIWHHTCQHCDDWINGQLKAPSGKGVYRLFQKLPSLQGHRNFLDGLGSTSWEMCHVAQLIQQSVFSISWGGCPTMTRGSLLLCAHWCAHVTQWTNCQNALPTISVDMAVSQDYVGYNWRHVVLVFWPSSKF